MRCVFDLKKSSAEIRRARVARPVRLPAAAQVAVLVALSPRAPGQVLLLILAVPHGRLPLAELLAPRVQREHHLAQRAPRRGRPGGAQAPVQRVDPGRERGGQRITLSPKEYTLLELLARRRGEVLPRSLIASQVWDMNFDSDTNVIDVAIRRLRAKIDDGFDARLIITVRGMGYVLEAPDEGAAREG